MIRRFKDKLHGVVTVVEGNHGMVMHNFPEDKIGRWVKDGNTYRYVKYSKPLIQPKGDM